MTCTTKHYLLIIFQYRDIQVNFKHVSVIHIPYYNESLCQYVARAVAR